MQMQAQEAEARAEAVEAAIPPPTQTQVNPTKLYVSSFLTAILSFAVVSGNAFRACAML